MAAEQVTDTIDRIHGPLVDFLFDTMESSYKGSHYKGQHLAAEQVTDTINRKHGRMAQRIRRLTSNPSVVDILFHTKEIYQKGCQYKGRIRRLTSNQKIGGSNPSVFDILFYTQESSYKGCQYKGQHLATEQATDTIEWTHGRMAQRTRRLTSNQKIGGSNPLIDFFFQRKLLRNRVYTRDNTWQLNK